MILQQLFQKQIHFLNRWQCVPQLQLYLAVMLTVWDTLYNRTGISLTVAKTKLCTVRKKDVGVGEHYICLMVCDDMMKRL